MGVYGEWRQSFTPTHFLAINVEWSASFPGDFACREGTPGSHQMGGWVGPIIGMSVLEKTKISCTCQESYHNFSVIQLLD